MWMERFVRVVRNSAKVENRSIASLGKGYLRWTQIRSPLIREKLDCAELYKWWDVGDRNASQGDDGYILSTDEMRRCLEAIGIDGNLPPRVSRMLDDDKVHIPKTGHFRMGYGLKAKGMHIKSVYMQSRRDAVRDHTYIITLYDNGVDRHGKPKPLKAMVARVLKIVSWRETSHSKPAYALKVRVLLTQPTASRSILYVNTDAQPGGSPFQGEWVGISKSVAHRQPLMLPRTIGNPRPGHRNIVMSGHLYDVCMVPGE